MSTVKVEIRGLAELEQKLRNETKKIASRVLRRAAKDAAEIWVEAISERAPEHTGLLRTSITMGSKTLGGEEGHLQVMVGPSKKAFYAMFQEFGTRLQAARPFIRPAFEETKQQVLDAVIENLKYELGSLKK